MRARFEHRHKHSWGTPVIYSSKGTRYRDDRVARVTTSEEKADSIAQGCDCGAVRIRQIPPMGDPAGYGETPGVRRLEALEE